MENIYKNKIKFEECIQISDINKEINKILLLYNTHNLVCSYEETLEIFQLNTKEKKLNSLQKILDPNFNTIEFLYETKENANNKNYLLICSDMIHIFYLYDNDKKSILLQSINNFDYQYVNQVYEKINGNIITLSNEYKISLFNNILITNDEIIDYNYIFNKGENFIEKYREEIYELDIDKLNKINEKIFSVIELFNNKLAYAFYINNDKELLISEYEDGFNNMFQLSEMVMALINDNYIFIINLKYYEVIIKLKANDIKFSYHFDNNKNNFFNYLFLAKEEKLSNNNEIINNCSDSENSDEQDNDDNHYKNMKFNFNIYDLKTILIYMI